MSTDDRKWEIIESEYLIRRPWLTARRDRVKLPTGVEIPEYYILEYPDWVNVIAITKEGKFVLVRQYRHGIKETRYMGHRTKRFFQWSGKMGERF